MVESFQERSDRVGHRNDARDLALNNTVDASTISNRAHEFREMALQRAFTRAIRHEVVTG
jgi:hypothetical protein